MILIPNFKKYWQLLFAACAFSSWDADPRMVIQENYSKMTPEEIVDSLTLEQKTAQMLLLAVYNIDEQKMSEIDYGAVLSKKESLPASEWRITVDQLQTAALILRQLFLISMGRMMCTV